MNLYEELAKGFRKNPSKVAIYTEEAEYTYQELIDLTEKMAIILSRHGLTSGDRIAVQADKSPEVLLIYLASLKLGITFLPLNTKYTQSEVEYFITDAQPQAFVHAPSRALELDSIKQKNQLEMELISLNHNGEGSIIDEMNNISSSLEPLASCFDNEIAVILYTSGTTGRPKGAMLSHRGLLSNAQALIETWEINANDRLLHCLPIFHVHGLFFACHTNWLTGASMYFIPKFDIEKVMRLLPKSTLFMGVPTYYTRLLSHGNFDNDTCKNMRLFISGSAPLLEATFNEFFERTGLYILERYGMTETGINTSNPLNGERKIASVGRAIKGVDLRVVDDEGVGLAHNQVGNVQVKSPHLFLGYWKKPEKTKEDFTSDGYFMTGDVGHLDNDRYLFLSGRKKDLIITGGLNVYPKEIEFTIDAIDGVTESAIIGVPHKDFGEAVVAVIVKGANCSITEEEFIGRLKTSHAGFKVPKKIIFANELPKNTMGKVQKNLLREKYAHLFINDRIKTQCRL